METQRILNLDANDTAFFVEQLEIIRAGSIDIEYPALFARSLFPIESVPEGTEVIKYRQYDRVGKAKLIANGAIDLPDADITAVEFSSPVHSYGMEFHYTTQDIRAARQAGVDLNGRKLRAVIDSMNYLEDQILWGLEAERAGLPGLFNAANITETSASAVWGTATPTQMLANLNGAVNQIAEDTKGIIIPDSLALPLDKYNVASNTPFSSSEPRSVLEVFLANNNYISDRGRIFAIPLLTSGKSSKTTMIAWSSNQEVMAIQDVMAPFVHDGQADGLKVKVPVEARTGGLVVYKPKGIHFVTGI